MPDVGFVFDCQPVKVIDGDTIDVLTPHFTFPVRFRLCDCWCPESKINSQIKKRFGDEAAKLEREFGLEAKKTISEMLQKVKEAESFVRARVLIDPKQPLMSQSTFDRIPATLWLPYAPARSINEAMVAMGFADASKEDQERRWVRTYGKSGTN